MSKLVVRITGLCAFVPQQDIYERPKNNQMRLLMVESSRPADLPSSHAHHAHEPHVPVFLCPSKNVVAGPNYRQPDLVYGGMAVFYLDDQDLKIKGARDNNLEILLEPKPTSGCHNDDNKYSFDWVTPLAMVSPGSEIIPDSCLCSPESGVDSSVIARIELREGKIRTAQLAYGSDHRVILWNFKVPSSVKRGCHYQVATDVAEFEVDIPDYVELVTSPIGRPFSNARVREAFNSKAESRIRLMTEGADIDTWLKNMPWADIFGTREPERYEKEPDIHFSHFYKLSSSYEDANVPHACGRCGPATVPHQGNPNCQPVRTGPNPNA